MSYIRGRVERVVYSKGSYHVLAIKVFEHSGLRNSKDTTAAGHLFGVAPFYGVSIELEGEWGNHKTYGRQFKIKTWAPWAMTTNDVVQFLDSCVGVIRDSNLLKRVSDFFGTDTYEALDSDDILQVAEGDGDLAALKEAQQKWQAVKGISNLASFLQDYDLGATAISAVYALFGMNSVDIVRENPYRLVEVDGISFHRADTLALANSILPGDPRRISAAVLWVVKEQVKQFGHLFVRRGDLLRLVIDLGTQENVAPFEVDDLDSAISEAIVTLVRDEALVVDAAVGVYPVKHYWYERNSASYLSRLLSPVELVIDTERFISDYEKAGNIELSDMQKKAVGTLLDNRVLVVTGAPGTGKTTVIRTFVHLFRSLGVPHMLMAPTGIAAKRLAHVTESQASTIHRGLRYDGISWTHDEGNPLPTRAVIVDELSMVDQELFYRLLSALEPDTMLVLVGDDAQLPSVGPGNVLRELIACPDVPTVRLDHVFRQAETSDIVLAAHKIRKGSSPLELPKKPTETEFKFVRMADEDQIRDLIVQMAVKLKSREANFQVVSPKYDGTVGVDSLNRSLRQALNPDVGQPQCDILGFQARIGDRLMVIKNNYKLNVYNGDICKLIDITRDSLRVLVYGIGNSPDVEVPIPKDEAHLMLKLAYAVTVHRCQGEEFETVIMPLVRAQGRMLQRNLFYTAVTRAKLKVWVLGEVDAVLRAVANDKVVQRNTALRRLIKPSD